MRTARRVPSFFKVFQRLKAVLAARAAADGIASLGGNRRVPDDELGRAVASGVAGLDANAKVPTDQLPTGVANGVAGLDANAKVPAEQLPQTAQWSPGDIIMRAAGVGGLGWLLCDGRAVARAGAYADLFAAIGTTFGAGDGVNTFNAPDFRNVFPIGASATRLLGATGGDEEVMLTQAQTPRHQHPYEAGGGSINIFQGRSTDDEGYPLPSTTVGAPGMNANSSSTGDGQAHPNMPPYVAINFLIRY